MGLSDMRDLSRVGVRAGIITEATMSGLSLASWFLETKLDAGYEDTSDQSDWYLMFVCFAKHGSHSCVCPNPGPRGKQS